MRYLALIVLAVSVLLLGCTSSSQPTPSPTPLPTGIPTSAPIITATPTVSVSAAPTELVSVTPTPSVSETPIPTPIPSVTTTEVSITANNYNFVPSQITLKKGAPAKLRITNTAGMHTFIIDAVSVKEDLILNQERVIDWTAEDVGKLSGASFYCSVHCASGSCGSDGMKGTITVSP